MKLFMDLLVEQSKNLTFEAYKELQEEVLETECIYKDMLKARAALFAAVDSEKTWDIAHPSKNALSILKVATDYASLTTKYEQAFQVLTWVTRAHNVPFNAAEFKKKLEDLRANSSDSE